MFLSTDAGGVGLNLQAASAVVNFEPPWNPARLEQRIGRVHRMGQSRPVHVIHMLTQDSIEERVWETLKLKKSLFAGVFDSATDEISFAKLGKKSMMQAVKEIFADQPGRPKPIIDAAPPAPVPVSGAGRGSVESPVAVNSPGSAGTAVPGVEKAAASLIEAGLGFLESLAARSSTGAPGGGLEQAISGLFTRDARTNRPALSIPLPESVTKERLTAAIAALLKSFG